jgi:hypothetical protein
MIIVQGEVYLKEWRIAILKKESEIVRKRYHAVVRTLFLRDSGRLNGYNRYEYFNQIRYDGVNNQGILER